jgi:peroxiredoxin
MKKPLIALLLLAMAGLAGYVLWFGNNPAPNVRFTPLAGSSRQLADLKGKMVLVNFWATSCPGCVEEMPQIKRMYQQYAASGFEVLAVDMSYDEPDYAKTFVEKNQLPFMVALDSQGAIAHAFGDIQLTPTSFLIDRQGRIIKRYVGEMNFNEVGQLLEANQGKA